MPLSREQQREQQRAEARLAENLAAMRAAARVLRLSLGDQIAYGQRTGSRIFACAMRADSCFKFTCLAPGQIATEGAAHATVSPPGEDVSVSAEHHVLHLFAHQVVSLTCGHARYRIEVLHLERCAMVRAHASSHR